MTQPPFSSAVADALLIGPSQTRTRISFNDHSGAGVMESWMKKSATRPHCHPDAQRKDPRLLLVSPHETSVSSTTWTRKTLSSRPPPRGVFCRENSRLLWFACYKLPQNPLAKKLKSQIRLSKGLTGFCEPRRAVCGVFLKSKERREIICKLEVGVSCEWAVR